MNQCICINDINLHSQFKCPLFTIGELYSYEYMTEGTRIGKFKLNKPGNIYYISVDEYKNYMMDLREFRELQLRKVCDEIA